MALCSIGEQPRKRKRKRKRAAQFFNRTECLSGAAGRPWAKLEHVCRQTDTSLHAETVCRETVCRNCVQKLCAETVSRDCVQQLRTVLCVLCALLCARLSRAAQLGSLSSMWQTISACKTFRPSPKATEERNPSPNVTFPTRRLLHQRPLLATLAATLPLWLWSRFCDQEL